VTDLTPGIILRCYKPGLSPVEFIARVRAGRKPKGLRYGVTGHNDSLRGCEVWCPEGGGTLYILADYGQFTINAHHGSDGPFARRFAEGWGGKRGRVVELTHEDLDREYANEYRRLNEP